MVFMGRSRNRPRGGAIQASTRKDGGGSHRDGSDDRDSRSSKNSGQFRGRERSRSPISKRPVTERLGDQYPERSASDIAIQESLRITVGNDMFREQQRHHSPLDDKYGSSLAERLGPPVTRSPLTQKPDRYGGDMEYRGQIDDDTFYKQMDEQYRRSSGRDERRGSPGRPPYRRDRDSLERDRDRHRDSRDRDRDRDRHRDLGRRPDDRDRDRRIDDRDRNRDIDRGRHSADQGRLNYDRNSSRDSGHLHDREMRSKERSPVDMYSGQGKFPEMRQEPVINQPPAQPQPPKPLKSILKKSTPVLEPKPESSTTALFPAGAPADPYREEPLYNTPGFGSGTQQQENRQKFTHGLPGMSNYMDIEDEEKFLYGEDAHAQRFKRNVSPDMTLKDRYSGGAWGQKTVEKDSYRPLSPDRQQSSWMDKREDNAYRDTQSGPQSNMNEFERLMMQQQLTMNPELVKEKTDMFSFGEPTQKQQQQQPPQSFMSQSPYESNVSRSEQTPTTVVDLLSIFTNKSTSSFLQSSNVTSTMNEPRVAESVKPKGANYDPTIENILKSIGFDFEMSKRMQEKAQNKPPEPKQDEMQMGINQTASFLEGGLSDDMKTNLLPKKKEEHMVESLIREAKESVSQITKVLASRESQATKFINEEPKHIQRDKPRRSPDRRISGKDYDDRDRKRRDSDSLERISKGHKDEPKSRDYHRQSSRSPEHSSSKTTQYSSSTYSDPYMTTSNSDPYKTSTHSDPYKTSSQSDPYTTASQIPPYTAQTDPYNSQISHPNTGPPPSQSMPYSQPYDPRYSAAPMPGQHNVPPPFMHGPPPHYPYGPPHMYPPGHPSGHPPPYGHPPGPNQYPPYHRFPPPNVPPYSAPPETTPPGTEATRLPPSVNATPPGRKSNLISVSTMERKKSPEPDFDRTEFKTIELKKSDRKIEEEKKKPLPVKKDIKSSSESFKKDTTTRVVSSTKSESNRTVLPPKSEQKPSKRPASDDGKKPKVLTEKEKQKLLKDKESRQRRIQSLEEELKRLRKQQNEIMRKKRRQKDGHKDPILLQNSKLQEEIAIQINKLRRATEETTRVLKESGAVDDGPPKSKRTKTEDDVKRDEPVKPVSQPPKKLEKPVQQDKKPQVQPKPEVKEKPPLKYEFFDPGGHWCRSCNVIAGNVFNFFSHLQGKKHQKSVSIYDRPWMTDPGKPEEKTNNVKVVPIKGAEFLMPASAFYCTLCKEFSGDDMCAETHLKSKRHYERYMKYLEDHQFYEQRLKLDKAAGSSLRKEEKEDTCSDKEDKYKKEKGTESKPKLEEKLPQKKTPELEKKSDNKTTESKKEVQKVKDLDKVSDKKSVVADPPKTKPESKVNEKGKEEEKTSQETESKAKIAIHISNKTGIKQVKKIPPRKSALLPPWNPVSKQQQQQPPAAPIITQTKKSDDSPASLDTFLTIGEKSKPLPVMKEPTGKLLFQNKKIVTAKDILEAFSGKAKEAKQAKETNEAKDSTKPNPSIERSVSKEEKEELKMLGIEPESTNLLAIPIPPPPRSQNMSLPKDKSLATSSAKDMYNVFYSNEDGTKDTAKPVSVVASELNDGASVSKKQSMEGVGDSETQKESLLKTESEMATSSDSTCVTETTDTVEPVSNVQVTELSQNNKQTVDISVAKSSETVNVEKMDVNVMEIDLNDIELPKDTYKSEKNITDSENMNVDSGKGEPEMVTMTVDSVKDEVEMVTTAAGKNESMEVDNTSNIVTIGDNETDNIVITENIQDGNTDIVDDVKSDANEIVNHGESQELESDERTSVQNIDTNFTNKLNIVPGENSAHTENVCSNSDNEMAVNPSVEVLESVSVGVEIPENSDRDNFVSSNEVDKVEGQAEELQITQDDDKEIQVVAEVNYDSENNMDVQFEVVDQNDQAVGSDSDSGTVDYDVSEQDIEEEFTEEENKGSQEESLDSTEQLSNDCFSAVTDNKLTEYFEPEIQQESFNSEKQAIEKQKNLVLESETAKNSDAEIIENLCDKETIRPENMFESVKSSEQSVEEQQAENSENELIENTGNSQSEILSGASERITMENSDKFAGVTIGNILKPEEGDMGYSEPTLGIGESSDNIIKEMCETVSSDVVPSLEFENTENSEIDKFSDLFGDDNPPLTLQEGGFSNDIMGTATLDELEKTITFDDLFSDQGDGLLNVNSDIVNEGLNNDNESEMGNVILENDDRINRVETDSVDKLGINETEIDSVEKLGSTNEMKDINPTLDEISDNDNEENNQGEKEVDEDSVLEEVSDEEDIVEKTEESHMELDEISNEDETEYIEENVNLEEVSDVSDGEEDQDDGESVHSGVSMDMGSDFEVLDECVDDEEEEEADQEEA